MSLDPKRKRRIKQKAWAESRSKYGPKIASLRGSKKAARNAYHSDIKSTRGAVDYLQNALGSAIKSAKSSGLRGEYLQQVVSELGAQMADSANIVPMAKQAGRAELQDTLSSLNDQLLTQRVSQQTSARDAIVTALKAARQKQAERQQTKHDNRKERTRTVKNAKIVTLNKLEEVKTAASQALTPPPADASSSDVDAYQKALAQKQDAIAFLNDLRQKKPSAMRLLAAEIASSAEGVDQFDALATVRRMMEQSRAAGKITNPFNAFPTG